MAAGMKPDVSTEAKAALESAIESGHARYLSGGDRVEFTVAGFAAWYAAERRLIREQVAREIEMADKPAPWMNKPSGVDGAWIDRRDCAKAARIARGGA